MTPGAGRGLMQVMEEVPGFAPGAFGCWGYGIIWGLWGMMSGYGR